MKTTSCNHARKGNRLSLLRRSFLGGVWFMLSTFCGAAFAATQPLIEVAAFGAAPVSELGQAGREKPRAGDYLLRPWGGPAAPQGGGEVETRILAAETWVDLFARVNEQLQSETLKTGPSIPGINVLPGLLPGKYVRFRASAESRRVEVDYLAGAEESYLIVVHPDGVQVQRQASDPKLVDKMRSDPAKASLFTATDAIGLPEAIVLQLVEIFAGDVDFHRELHLGYRCTIAYEVHYRDGHIDQPGRVLAVEFVVRNRRLQAYWFDDGNGGGYYTESGRNMRKVFRRSPVEFSRVTSGYTLARFHPILGTWRAHRGEDYAAPIGSRVLATADGSVEFIGPQGQYGNLVILEHQNQFLTYYAHLHGFAPGLTLGSRVKGGQMIGYVGMTGLATGPHVHYEFRVRSGSGEWVSVPAPEQVEAPSVNTPSFFQAVDRYRDQLQVAANAHFVILD
ncbi:MAG TPA: M23 family metallopeptidase [Burkholderiales bacterium]|nr:M23 family metallopeptidase [Burkholderiales bacterium]